jgi:hypothetical protein
MISTAPDIRDLEQKLNDGEGDDVLNSRAIEIFERLTEDLVEAKGWKDKARQRALEQEAKDFEDLIDEIQARRHEHVLDKFAQYIKRRMKG